jgi:xylulokinase
MLLLGIDVGTSSIKVSIVDALSGKAVAAAQYPEMEAEIISLQPGWAEQDPESWWSFAKLAFDKAKAKGSFNAKDIKAIGIAYQMHGLVLLGKEGEVLRNSIIWCDSRAVPYGDAAFEKIGVEKALQTLLNSPGNFTAAKLAWVKEHEPQVYEQIDKIMLPGDFIAQRLTGTSTSTPSMLSEGIFWDFEKNELSEEVMATFGFDKSIIPPTQPVFSEHGKVAQQIAAEWGLTAGIPVSYKAGDQPNNALSLNVLQPGEVAATAGTSGVIYGVAGGRVYDQQSRINSFAHVNHSAEQERIGVLLCINGTGIANKWVRQISGGHMSYPQINEMGASVKPGSNGLKMLPFGNGAERMLNNKLVGAHLLNADFNLHTTAHLYRATQEGIAFSFRYGLDIMRENGMTPQLVRAGRANMFLSAVFTQAFADATNTTVELYENDGSIGAALGAGIGAGIFSKPEEAFQNQTKLGEVHPQNAALYNELYQEWKGELEKHL